MIASVAPGVCAEGFKFSCSAQGSCNGTRLGVPASAASTALEASAVTRKSAIAVPSLSKTWSASSTASLVAGFVNVSPYVYLKQSQNALLHLK